MRNKCFILIVTLLTLSTLYACANNNSMARKHTEALEGTTQCSECHSGSLGAMNHRAVDFYKRHGIYSGISAQTCVVCHQQSFCSDCHAHKAGNTPSEKFFTDAPERTLQHRGDYLNQHRIDGRVNPVLCAKCHGRQNNQGCTLCHRK